MAVTKERNKRGLNFWNAIIIVSVKDVWVEVSPVSARELLVNTRSHNHDFEKKQPESSLNTPVITFWVFLGSLAEQAG